MNLVEHTAKELVLKSAGVRIPNGALAHSPEEVSELFRTIGPCAIKAQVPTGKRGKAGGIKLAGSAQEAAARAADVLGTTVGGWTVDTVLVEERVAIAQELYAAVLPDTAAQAALILFSSEGGMDIEEIMASRPDALLHRTVMPGEVFGTTEATTMLAGLDLGTAKPEVAEVLVSLLRIFRETDAELIEINPLALLEDSRVVALDCKFALDDSAAFRQQTLAAAAANESRGDLERRGAEAGLKFMELEGNVGILANGAGLAMTTMDVITHFGGRPANFLEIGGEAYTKAGAALKLVVSNPRVKSLVVNFCGAFARTDVMAEGVVQAWEQLKPDVPVFFSIHGTGEDEAIALVRDRLGIEPYELMEDAVSAAVKAAI